MSGRGGWTWYTGSAGWMQRAGVESILGLRIRGAFLHLDPCIPKSWPSFEMTVAPANPRDTKSASTIPPGSVEAFASPRWTGLKLWNGPCDCGSPTTARSIVFG